MILIANHDREIAGWAGQRLGVTFQEPYKAFGFADNAGTVRAASVLNDYYTAGNCEWTHVGPLHPRALKFLSKYVFNDLGCSRVTAKTRRGNTLVARQLGRAFQFECVQRRYFGPEKADDALCYVLFRENATRWLQ